MSNTKFMHFLEQYPHIAVLWDNAERQYNLKGITCYQGKTWSGEQ